MPLPPRRKYVPDVGWDEKLKGYVMRVLLQRNQEDTAFQAISKDLEGIAGYGPTERDAMTAVKMKLKQRLQKLVDDGGKFPFIEISCVRTHGAKIKWCLITLDEKEQPK